MILYYKLWTHLAKSCPWRGWGHCLHSRCLYCQESYSLIIILSKRLLCGGPHNSFWDLDLRLTVFLSLPLCLLKSSSSPVWRFYKFSACRVSWIVLSPIIALFEIQRRSFLRFLLMRPMSRDYYLFGLPALDPGGSFFYSISVMNLLGFYPKKFQLHLSFTQSRPTVDASISPLGHPHFTK